MAMPNVDRKTILATRNLAERVCTNGLLNYAVRTDGQTDTDTGICPKFGIRKLKSETRTRNLCLSVL